MLAVTTFSLGIMVSALSTASSSATPRTSKVLLEDSTSQNALSTFIGAFIFSLIGTIALTTGFYGVREKVVLFFVMIIVVVIIIFTFFRWIDYLSRLGRLGEIIDKVEKKADQAIESFCTFSDFSDTPFRTVPSDAYPLYSEKIGYLQYLDAERLCSLAEKNKGIIYVMRLPGSFTDKNEPLAYTTWNPDEDQTSDLIKAFIVGNERIFDQDPRFGLVIFAEIGSRALSPALNDPGTAIDVIGRLVRTLTLISEQKKKSAAESLPGVVIPDLAISDLFDDSFTSISRDGAGCIEIGIRLQKAFLSLARLDDPAFKRNAKRLSASALSRSELALGLKEDFKILSDLAQSVQNY